MTVIMNKSLIIFLFFLIAGSRIVYSQKWKLTRHEVHFGLGTVNVFGDIGGAASASNMWGLKDIRVKETGLSVYVAGRYKLNTSMAIKVNLIYGFTKGSDVDSKNAVRNFSYKTSLFEPSAQYEYYFLKEDKDNRGYGLYNRRGMYNNFNIIAAYGFIGLGAVMASPKVTYNGREPVTSYESINKFGVSPVIPIGMGCKMTLDKYWALGFEFGRRFAFGDNLDGLTTSFSKHNDTYYFAVFHAIYRLESDRYGKLLILKKSKMPYSQQRRRK
jgi:hypothetical protein